MKVLVTGGSGFIGTNFTQLLASEHIQFSNIDIAPPKDDSLQSYWTRCDIMDYDKLLKAFHDFKPTAVVHLAAETDTDPAKTLDDYRVNTEGSRNVLAAIKSVNTVERVVWTSTQFVNQSVEGPRHDEDYAPHTVYGESKIITEKDLRAANLDATWTIIRPTNVWGAWHLRYPFEFWKVLSENKYFHPGRQKVIRSYAYVGNVVDQVKKILTLPKETMHKKVFYVGDRPIDLYDWVNGFSIAQTGRQVRVIPRPIVYSLAFAGDFLRLFNVKFPITTSRYRSMTTDNPASMEHTFTNLGEPKYSLEEGIAQTVEWLKKYHPNLVRKSL